MDKFTKPHELYSIFPLLGQGVSTPSPQAGWRSWSPLVGSALGGGGEQDLSRCRRMRLPPTRLPGLASTVDHRRPSSIPPAVPLPPWRHRLRLLTLRTPAVACPAMDTANHNPRRNIRSAGPRRPRSLCNIRSRLEQRPQQVQEDLLAQSDNYPSPIVIHLPLLV